MDSDYIIFKLSNGYIGIHNKEEGIGWIVTPEGNETRKDLIEWAKSELPKELEKKKKVKMRKKGNRKLTELEKLELEKKDRVCRNCEGIFHSQSERKQFCSPKCANQFSYKNYKLRRERKKNEKSKR